MFQHPQAHRWTWYSNAGDVAKEIEHVIIYGRWRMSQNCRVYRRAQFFNTDYRLVVATLKLQLKSGRMVPSQSRLDVGKLKHERVAEEFVNRQSGDLGGLGAFWNPEELWSAFKTTILDVNGGWLGIHHRTKKNFVSQGTLPLSLALQLWSMVARAEMFRELRHKTVHALRVDKEAYVQGICEGLEHHL